MMDTLAPLKSIMTSELITVRPEATLAEIEDIFNKNRIHHIPVTNDHELVGLISKSDYLFFKRGFNDLEIENAYDKIRLNRTTAESIMTIGLAKLSSNDRIGVAIEIFKENLFHAIPIVDGGKLKGIVTTYDIISKFTEKVSRAALEN